MKITFKSKPLTLVGRRLKIGVRAPSFTATTGNLKSFSLDECKTPIKVITSFLSLDTPVCETQVKEFNKRATGLSDDVTIIGISCDLPFAQTRFCESNNIERVITLSDYKNNSFGINYGLLIKELHLLARAVIILDKNNTIRYVEVVEEATYPPDYDAALRNLKEVMKSPPFTLPKDSLSRHCIPCEAGIPPLAREAVDHLRANVRDWELVDNIKIAKTFKFKDFSDAKYFVDLVSVIAEEQGHHPNISIIYNKVVITLTTHAIGGLSENDFIMARIIDEMGVENEI